MKITCECEWCGEGREGNSGVENIPEVAACLWKNIRHKASCLRNRERVKLEPLPVSQFTDEQRERAKMMVEEMSQVSWLDGRYLAALFRDIGLLPKEEK